MSTTVSATTDRISLIGLSARGHHGVLPFEREEGQLFTVDVILDLGQRGTAVAAAVGAVLGVATCVISARALTALMSRVLASRRFRDVGGVAFFAVMMPATALAMSMLMALFALMVMAMPTAISLV